MYFTSSGNNQPRQTNSLGFSEPPSDFQKSLDSIIDALMLNPRGGYVAGSAARKKLQDAFESVPIAASLILGLRLLSGDGSIAKLFHYRLAGATRVAMLRILLRKAGEFIHQKVIDAQERAKTIRKICAIEKQMEALTQRVCAAIGDDSAECRNARSEVSKGRQEDRNAGIQCP
jgi:hypothetical protein